MKPSKTLLPALAMVLAVSAVSTGAGRSETSPEISPTAATASAHDRATPANPVVSRKAPTAKVVATKTKSVETKWTSKPWSSAFTSTGYRIEHAPTADFAGHPLDVTFDPTGAAWTVGEFGMQVTRGYGGAIGRVDLPLKTYLDAGGNLLGWTAPFSSTWGRYTATSELGEAIISTPGAVWASYGGQLDVKAPATNYSLLVRISTTAPYDACQIPLPGGNSEALGLAYDPARDRVHFAQSLGDQGTHVQSTLGWVPNTDLGALCQNDLDYGGNPALTPEQNTAIRNAAAQSIASLRCTAAQEAAARRGENTPCVHVTTRALSSGATHLGYDAKTDSLWVTNWFTNTLSQVSLKTGNAVVFRPPPALRGTTPGSWQIAVADDAVYVNEYGGNRLLRFTKKTRTWSATKSPTTALGTRKRNAIQTHSIHLDGNRLWFTVSDEDYDPGITGLGYVDVRKWAKGKPKGVVFTGWNTLAMRSNAPKANHHSFRGIDVLGNQVAVTDHGDMQTLVLTMK